MAGHKKQALITRTVPEVKAMFPIPNGPKFEAYVWMADRDGVEQKVVRHLTPQSARDLGASLIEAGLQCERTANWAIWEGTE